MKYLVRSAHFGRRVRDIGAQAHACERHCVGEHLDAGVDVDDAFEMAESDDEGAQGEEDDKGEAHDCAVGDGCPVHALQEGEEVGGEHHHFASWRPAAGSTGSSSSSGGGTSSTRTS